METLISHFAINFLNPQSSQSAFIFHFPSPSRENQNFLPISRRKWSCNPGAVRFSSVRGQCASDSYGGWDDFRLAGESDQFRQFLNSIGIDDQKHVFVFLLGLLCAFAISRVRFSSIVVFPASILVFAIGFSFGFVRSGGVGEVSLIGDKRRGKEENLIANSDKLRKLAEIFNDFHVEVGNLKYDIQKAIDSREITVTDLGRYVKVIESISLSVSNARNVTDESVKNLGKFSAELAESKKASKRKKEPVEIGYELFQYIGGLFKDKLADSKSGRVKNNVKRETMEKVMDDQARGNGPVPSVKGVVLGSVHSQEVLNKSDFDEAGNGRIKVALENNTLSSEEVDGGPNGSTAGKQFNYQNNGLEFTSNGHVSLKMDHNNHTETWESPESLLDSVDFGVRTKQMDNKASFVQEQMLKQSNGVYRPNIRGKIVNGTYESHSREEHVNRNDDSHLADHMSGHESELPSLSSLLVSDDILFDRYVTEANDLLKQAKEFVRVRHNEERAEIVLYRSAKLLSKAISMKPMSLLAVGQSGNTCLLHGELKLRISRELRMHLSRSDPLSVEKWLEFRIQSPVKMTLHHSSLMCVKSVRNFLWKQAEGIEWRYQLTGMI